MTPPRDSPPSPLPYIIGWSLFVPYAGLAVALALVDPSGTHGAERAGYVTGMLMMSVGLPAAVAVVATVRRSVAALAAAAALTALGLCGVGGSVIKHYADRQAKIADLGKRVDEIKKRVGSSKGTAAERAAEIDRMVADVERTADVVGDHDADALRCAALTIRDVAAPGRAYDAKIAEMTAIGLLEAAKIQTREDLDARFRLVTEAEAANEAVDVQVRGMAAGFERCMRAHDVPEAMAHGAADVMRHDPRVADLATFRDVERRVLGAMRAMLTFFDEEWGRWHAKGDTLVIDRPEKLERYRTIKQALDAAIKEESEVQKRIMGTAPG